MPDITVDWLSFSCENFLCKSTQEIFGFFEGLNYRHSVNFDVKKGQFGFAEHLISILGFSVFRGEDNSTTLFQIHGKGCALIDEEYPGGIQGFLKEYRQYFRKVTRLDLCADDREGLLQMETMENKVNNGMLRGSSRYVRPHIPRDYAGNRCSGGTIYVGSRNSDAYIRIYDKQAQMGTAEHWVRVEIELKGSYASDVVDMILSELDTDISELYCGLVYDRIRFLSHKGDIHHTEYDRVCKWWTKFLDGCTVGRKLTRNDETNMQGVTSWLDRVVAPSLAMVQAAYGRGYVVDMINRGRDRMTVRHQQILAEYEAEAKGHAFEYDLDFNFEEL